MIPAAEPTRIADAASRAATLQALRHQLHVDIEPQTQPEPEWSYDYLRARLCELSSPSGAGLLTAAMQLVVDAQQHGEPAVWIETSQSSFFAPDAAVNGVDLAALPIVRLQDAQQAARAAARLLQSGAFGLIVLDLSDLAMIPAPLQNRLVQLARAHAAAVICLTRKPDQQASLSVQVSLRAAVSLHRRQQGYFAYCIKALKDKQQGRPWSQQYDVAGPPSLEGS